MTKADAKKELATLDARERRLRKQKRCPWCGLLPATIHDVFCSRAHRDAQDRFRERLVAAAGK